MSEPALRPPATGALLLAMLLALLPATPGANAGSPAVTIEDPGHGTVVEIDRSAMRQLPHSEFSTSTVWTEGVDRYGGVLLQDLLAAAGIDTAAGNGRVQVSALDGYSAVLAFSEITAQAPLLAFLRNGDPMPARAQGPFWLLWPFDDNPAFRTETTYARSVWQVSHLLVER